ncbi:MAG: Wzz/FepE/Etk N-terminal domain-containing protein, partial [Candidatus Acidiferrum sp.]
MTTRKSAGMIENKRSLARYNDSDFAMDQHRGGMHGRSHVQQQLTAADIWRTLVKRKFTILGFAAVVLALSAVYAYTRVPLYEGVARLQIDPSRSTDLGLDDGTKVPGSSTDVDGHVKTEVAIIQSETVAMRVMNALRLFSNPHFAGPLAVGTEV